MEKKVNQFVFEVYDSEAQLSKSDAALLLKAREITKIAYAPYSNFHVSAVAKLTNGEIVTGTNQENASYPVGICAERALLSALGTLFPNVAIDTMAIAYHNINGESNKPVSPCGMCRQALVEYENRTKSPMRLILSGMDGEVFVIEQASQLLPLSFGGDDLK
ncbi:cytidine deaminase [Ferruginibacter sp. SUN002]|uniref:cytidine deaminase n=1 Tax=Ferruginibacter sp. SUN002 TaxID=2937789 RepID=UPI003D35A648